VGLIVAGALVVSCLLRLPLLERPLGASHEWLAAHTLNTHVLWRQVGLPASHYSLILSHPTSADRAASSDQLRDAAGDSYFVSFPPLAFLVAHGYFQATGLAPTPAALRALGIVVHLVAGLLFYFLARRLIPGREDAVVTPALIAFLVYLFTPLATWVFSNNFFPVTLVQPFWLAAILSLLVYLDTGSVWSLGAFAATSFAACYTEWTADLFLVVALVWAGPRVRAARPWRAIACASAGVLVSANLLLVWQNARIAGLSAYAFALWSKFADRSGMLTSNSEGLDLYSVGAYVAVAKNYVRGFGPVLLLVVALLAIVFVTRVPVRTRGGSSGDRLRLALVLLGVPVVLDHVLLFNHLAAHDYTLLKDVAFVSLLVGALVSAIETHWASWPAGPSVRSRLHAVCLAAAALCLPVFMLEYYRAPAAWNAMRLGLSLRDVARPGDALIVLGSRFAVEDPIVTYYAGRNFRVFDRRSDVLDWLRSHRPARAALIETDSTWGVSTYRSLSMDEATRAVQDWQPPAVRPDPRPGSPPGLSP
jgi:hypothetical protein